MAEPLDFLPELSNSNGGKGMDPVSFVFGCAESAMVVALIHLFRPRFTLFEGYVLRKGFNENRLREWEATGQVSRSSIEAALNYLCVGELFSKEPDSDLLDRRIDFMTETLAEITREKLKLDFPDRYFVVSIVDEKEDYYLTFCQAPPV